MKVNCSQLFLGLACLAILLVSVTAVEAAFFPTDVNGNVLWLDAADTSTISTGSTFTWTDKSTVGGGTVSSSGDNRPTSGSATQNGKNLVAFDGAHDGTGDYLTGSAVLASGDDNYTYIAVWKADEVFWSYSQTIFVQDSGQGLAYRGALLAQKQTGKYGFSGYNADAYVAPYVKEEWNLTAMEVDDYIPTTPTPNITIHDGDGTGVSTYTGTTAYQGSLRLGAGGIAVGTQWSNPAAECFGGVIAEILVYDRLLTDGSTSQYDNELNDVFYYLDQKWGLGNGLTATPTEDVPEPSTLVLLVAGLVAIGVYRLRRR